MRDGALEVEFRKSEEATNALTATRFVYSEGRASGRKLVSLPLTVEPHRSKNSSRGVINCFDLRNVSDEDIADGLSEYGVTAARRILTRRGTVPTNNIILTFDTTDMPNEVRVGYIKVRVRPYVPAPMRCYRCQRFGHTKDNCRGRPTCSKCASQDHTDDTCDSETPRCVNCGEGQKPHSAYDRSCPTYVKEKEINTIKATRNLSFKEAREVYNQNHPKTSYAQKVKVTNATDASQMSVAQLVQLLKRFGLTVVATGMSALRLRPSDDEGDGEESLLPRALEVPSGSEPEDDGGLPGSALQYLRYVRRTVLDKGPRSPKILIFRSADRELSSLSPFQRKDGCDRFGSIVRCDRMRDGALEVEFRKSEEAAKALDATRFVFSEGRASGRRLVSIPLTVEPHRSKNSSRGVINCFDLRGVSDEDIADGLADFGVTAARRIMTKRGTVSTNNIILTFDSTDLPSEIRVGYVKVRVRPFVPAPMRCFRCQRFGHTKDNCRGRPTCSKCASQDHTDETCDSETPRCVNCGEGQTPHSAYDRSCPAYVKEKEIMTIKATRNLSFKEAREVYNQSHPKTSYAQKEPAAAASGPSLSRQWQQTVESDFSGLRCRVARWKARHAPQLRRRAAQLSNPSASADPRPLASADRRTVLDKGPRSPKILIFRSADRELSSLSPFQRKDGCDRFGSIVRCDRMRDGALEVEFRKSEEAAKALDATRFVFSEGRASGRRLVSIPLTVEPHRSKNSSRGVINCFDLRGVSDEDIADGLADFGVTAARRIMTKRGTVSTNNIILTFDSTDLPSEIRVGYVKVRVRPFVPAPMRCFRCQRFGHTKDNCRGRPTCSKCASQDHTDETCDSETPRCVNCGEGQTPHSAYDRSCPAYVKEKEIMTIKATRNLSFKEAREVYNQSHPKTSYAQKPPAEDRDAWLAVCRQDADGGTVDTGLAPPSLLTIAACLQSQLLALLEHLLHWSRLQGLGDGRAAWLFAVMAALEKPLPADTCAWLREAKDDTRLAAACLLICLVGRYFGQVDLADPYR
ncbi:Gem-associated protein 2 [Amphibalanus amphitrite]|uniref:Gem-associated protein 2 n=1 Tax=Amphibalanus amphitrite TaxID=1232801 RepID=A0A6A4W2P0_AMPAM|nr:Gem-associated protein 2 [Amphibalanus amphitrite]